MEIIWWAVGSWIALSELYCVGWIAIIVVVIGCFLNFALRSPNMAFDKDVSDRPMDRGVHVFPRSKKFADRWDAIFGSKEDVCQSTNTDVKPVKEKSKISTVSRKKL